MVFTTEIVIENQKIIVRSHNCTTDDDEINQYLKPSLSNDNENNFAVSIPKKYSIRPLLYPNYLMLVSISQKEQKIIGAAAYGYKEIKINGKYVNVGVGIDGIVHPDFQSLGIITKMNIMLKSLDKGSKYHLGSAKSTNIAAIKFMKRAGGVEQSTVFSYQWFTQKYENSCENVRLLSREDSIKAMNDQFSNHTFFPRPEELVDSPFYKGTFILERNESKAQISLWNGSEISNLRVVGSYSVIPFYILFFCEATNEDVELLGILFEKVSTLVHQKGIEFLVTRICSKEHDTMFKVLKSKGLTGNETKFIQHLGVDNGNLPIYPEKQIFDPRDVGTIIIPKNMSKF
jgi:hypothetical protein